MNGITKGDVSSSASDSLLHGLRVVFITDESRPDASAWVFRQYGAQTLVMTVNPTVASASEAVLVVNVQSEAGQRVMRRIVRTADVLVVRLEINTAAFRYLELESLEQSNPGLVTLLPTHEARARAIARPSDANAGLPGDKWEVMSALAGLWYRDRRNGAGIRIQFAGEAIRPFLGDVGYGSLNRIGTELDVRDMLLSVDFKPGEIDAMIRDRWIAFQEPENE